MIVRVNKDGYVEWCWGRGGKKVKVAEHRVIMEREIGRPLRSDEFVHHRNHIKTDNRVENLEIMTPEQHGIEHGRFPSIDLTCEACGKRFKRRLTRIRERMRDGKRRVACGPECAKVLVAERMRRWREAHPKPVRVPRVPMWPQSASCGQCGASFSKWRAETKFCSHRCSELASKGRPGHVRWHLPDVSLVCADCGKSFVRRAHAHSRTSGTVYCSPSCASRARMRMRPPGLGVSPGPATCERCGRTMKLTPTGRIRRHFADEHKGRRCA